MDLWIEFYFALSEKWAVGVMDHGLDRMFWEGKGAFILGFTSPFKAIMIDRPGMRKVKN
jgi:hypothetical protein